MNYFQYDYQLSAMPIIRTSAQPVMDQPAVMVQPYTNQNQQTTQFVQQQNNPNWIMSGFTAPISSANGYTPMSPGQTQLPPILQTSANEVTHPLVLEIAQDEARSENLSIPNFDILIERPVDNTNNFWIAVSNELTPPPSPASGDSAKPTRQQRIRNKDGPKRFRTAYTAEQVAVLEKFYADNRYIRRMDRIKMSNDLQLSEGIIKVWFQNRRMKSKHERLANIRNAVSPQTSSVRNPLPANSTVAVGSNNVGTNVNNQAQQRHTFGNMNREQQHTPIVNQGQQHTPPVNQGQQYTPVVNQGQQHTPVVNQGQQHVPIVNQGQQHTPVGNGAVPSVNTYYDSNLDRFLGGYNQGEVEITAELIPLS